MLYHVATIADWEARSADHYRPAGLADEGFVHCSTAGQVVGVLQRYYKGRSDLLRLSIDPAGLTVDLVWEDTSGRGERFPHIYGPIDLAAVVGSDPIAVDENGTAIGSERSQL